MAEPDAIVAWFARWAAEVRWDRLAENVRRMAKDELADLLGDMAAGHALLGVPAWLAASAAWSGAGPCATIAGGRAAPASACLLNGYFAHALEFDDTHDAAVLHAGASVIPAVLAAAELRAPVAGARMLEAIVIGIELTCRLGVATRLSLVEGGWIYSGLLGHFGAAAGAARIFSEDPAVWQSALGIAYVLASGNHQSTREGAETKHLQPAIAASHGVLAAAMAAGGLAGVRQPFLGEDGLDRVYLRGRLDAERVVADPDRFEIARLSFKPYPSCRLTHPAVTAALALRERVGVDGISALTLSLGPQAYDVVGRDLPERRAPASRLAAQFSAYWAVSVALAHGELSPAHLASEVPQTPAVARLIGAMRCEEVDSGEGGARDIGSAALVAEGDFGRVAIRARNAKGHPDDPLTGEALGRKFAGNLALAGVSAAEAARLAAAIETLDGAADGSGLMRRFATTCSGR